MIGIAPQKGKAIDKLPTKILASFDNTKYLVSVKFDGNQVFIHKEQDGIRMYTSDWKEFHIKAISQELMAIPGNFLIVGEYLHGCEGKLGDRTKSAILTTFRTNHNKGLLNSSTEEAKAMIKVFDFIEINSMHVSGILYTTFNYDEVAHSRIARARRMLKGLSHLSVIDTVELSGREARDYARGLVRRGFEGAMLIRPNTTYHYGKRVNHVVKLKYRRTADLLCVGFEDGKDGFDGMIGALILKDSKGRSVSVGTGGGSHAWRNNKNRVMYLGSVIEIEYEQIMSTYIQPSLPDNFLRSDKNPEEID